MQFSTPCRRSGAAVRRLLCFLGESIPLLSLSYVELLARNEAEVSRLIDQTYKHLEDISEGFLLLDRECVLLG